MKLIWPVLLGIFRALYLCYSWWCRLFLPALLGVLALSMGLLAGAYPLSRTVSLWILALLALLAALAVIGVYWRRTSDDPNPWQSGFLAWFGTLKLFKNAGGSPAVKLHWPSSYLVENPRGYRISGASMRDILNQLQPGDILLRGYEGYVDGEFIRRSSLSSQNGFKPGWFTHVALYVGELTPADRAQVPAAFRDDPGYFSLGPQMVIHSMAKGVHTEDILTFLRCDYLTVLRVPPELSLVVGKPADIRARCKQANPASVSDEMVTHILQELQAGQTISRDRAVLAARQSALEKIGESYDFDCSDTTEFNRFSCAELLYYCLRGVLAAIDLKPQAHAFYPLAPQFTQLKVLERSTITPDDYYDLVANGTLHCVWEDSFSKSTHG